jgi:hypothetical protein
MIKEYDLEDYYNCPEDKIKILSKKALCSKVNTYEYFELFFKRGYFIKCKKCNKIDYLDKSYCYDSFLGVKVIFNSLIIGNIKKYYYLCSDCESFKNRKKCKNCGNNLTDKEIISNNYFNSLKNELLCNNCYIEHEKNIKKRINRADNKALQSYLKMKHNIDVNAKGIDNLIETYAIVRRIKRKLKETIL